MDPAHEVYPPRFPLEPRAGPTCSYPILTVQVGTGPLVTVCDGLLEHTMSHTELVLLSPVGKSYVLVTHPKTQSSSSLCGLWLNILPHFSGCQNLMCLGYY